jgi:hypothetical protein
VDPGGEHGPYQIAPLARGFEVRFTQLCFTLSTWNPDQVVLMTATIFADESRPPVFGPGLTDHETRTG